MTKFKEILIYVVLIAVAILAVIVIGKMAYNSFFQEERIPITLNEDYINSIKRQVQDSTNSAWHEKEANRYKAERDSLLGLEVRFVGNNTQYKKDYGKKTVNQTDQELIKWSERK